MYILYDMRRHTSFMKRNDMALHCIIGWKQRECEVDQSRRRKEASGSSSAMNTGANPLDKLCSRSQMK
jgi:hypothetical protein